MPNPQRLGAVGGQGRPADQAHGPHRLNFATWRLPVAPLGRFGVLQPVAPSYKYKGWGVENRTHTHTHTPHFTHHSSSFLHSL